MDDNWHVMMEHITEYGEPRADRTGVGTMAVFGMSARWDLRAGFPACTTKKLYFGQVRAELAAFLAGAESLEEFHRHGCTIWDANAAAWRSPRHQGDVGRIYGAQWRRWQSSLYRSEGGMDVVRAVQVDQLRELTEGIIRNPHGRRHIVQTWNPGELSIMCLPPCHVHFQCFASDAQPQEVESAIGLGSVAVRGYLDLHFHMRSLDVFLGMPFDVASYALLLHLLGRATSRTPRSLIMTSGDTHVYNNHRAQVAEVLSRRPRPLPTLRLADGADLFAFEAGMAWLEGYDPHPPVAAPMNV